jgi:succinylarginine dihydrolase
LDDAIKTYFFNSQIVTASEAGKTTWTILCPVQVQRNPVTHQLVKRLCAEQVFHAVHFVDLGQSMNGGGGPACLRLRVPLSEQELASVPASALWTENRDSALRDIISDRYPSELKLADLANPEICQHALETRGLIAKCLGPKPASG